MIENADQYAMRVKHFADQSMLTRAIILSNVVIISVYYRLDFAKSIVLVCLSNSQTALVAMNNNVTQIRTVQQQYNNDKINK